MDPIFIFLLFCIIGACGTPIPSGVQNSTTSDLHKIEAISLKNISMETQDLRHGLANTYPEGLKVINNPLFEYMMGLNLQMRDGRQVFDGNPNWGMTYNSPGSPPPQINYHYHMTQNQAPGSGPQTGYPGMTPGLAPGMNPAPAPDPGYPPIPTYPTYSQMGTYPYWGYPQQRYYPQQQSYPHYGGWGTVG